MTCRSVEYVDGDGRVVGLIWESCNLKFGCGVPGCRQVRQYAPGRYNDAGGYDIPQGYMDEVLDALEDAGTPEQLRFLEQFGAMDPAEASEKASELGFTVEPCFLSEEEKAAFAIT